MQALRTSLIPGALAVAVLASCTDQPAGPDTHDPPPTPSEAELDEIFAEAGTEFDVPASLLKSIGYVETRWEMVVGGVEFPGVPPAFGIMALRGERLERGAELARVTQDAVRSDATANIRAAAALLREYADEAGLNRGDLSEWAPAVARYSGIEAIEGQAAYVHDDVYATLQAGQTRTTPEGDPVASLTPTDVSPNFVEPPPTTTENVDQSGAIWRPSPNYNSRPSGAIGNEDMIIVHTCEGSYSGCWSWLTNPSSGVSAHYVIREDGGEVSQLVRERDRAWHIGASYNCSRNDGVDCWRNDHSSNHFTVGIEHGGFASQSSFDTRMIDRSARLACNITQRHNIPRDRFHILGHAQLQPWNRTDPGPNWPWSDYYNRINAHCGSDAIIVDSNNSLNDAEEARMEVSSNWTASNNVSGYYGTGYWWASTESVSDGATFWFYLPQAATKTVDAWWPAASDRSEAAPHIAFNANGTRLGTVHANQRINGGRWNQLGTWNFTAGWNRVVISRWTSAEGVVIADALRVR